MIFGLLRGIYLGRGNKIDSVGGLGVLGGGNRRDQVGAMRKRVQGETAGIGGHLRDSVEI